MPAHTEFTKFLFLKFIWSEYFQDKKLTPPFSLETSLASAPQVKALLDKVTAEPKIKEFLANRPDDGLVKMLHGMEKKKVQETVEQLRNE